MGKHSIENERNERAKTTKKKSGFLKFLKVLGIIILILILILVGVGIGGYIYINNRLGTMNYVHINKDDIEINEGVEESLNGYRTIALFGVDSREEQLEKGTRSDCIMLAVIDQKNKKVNLRRNFKWLKQNLKEQNHTLTLVQSDTLIMVKQQQQQLLQNT